MLRLAAVTVMRLVQSITSRRAARLWRTHTAAIDMVITDLRMLEMSGSSLADRLYVDSADLPIVFMSGYADDDATALGGASGVFLAKPFSSAQLLSAIATVLERRAVGATPSPDVGPERKHV